MFKGGYKLIDLENKAITVDDSTGVTVPGVYAAIEGNYRKPLIFTGVHIGTVEDADAYVNMCVGADSVYHGIIGVDEDGTPLIITVDDDDKVTVTTYSAPAPDEGNED